MIHPDHMADWTADCLKWRGQVLTGNGSHWCDEWDGLPVDETSDEWGGDLSLCNCGFRLSDAGEFKAP